MAELGTIECTVENCLTDIDGSLVLSLRARSDERRAVRQILDKARSWQTEPNKRLSAQFSYHREKRSLNANAYFHVLVGKIAKVTQQSETDVKRQLVLDYGAPAEECGEQIIAALPQTVDPEKYYPYPKWLNDFVSPKGKPYSQYLLYKKTSELDTAEMARLIDGTVAEAQALDIETKTPEELEKIKQLWATDKE